MADEAVIKAFEELGKKFKLEDKVVKWLTAAEGLGVTSVDDFLHVATKPEELASLAEAAGAENKMLQTSRARQGWTSLKKASEDAEILKRKRI